MKRTVSLDYAISVPLVWESSWNLEWFLGDDEATTYLDWLVICRQSQSWWLQSGVSIDSNFRTLRAWSKREPMPLPKWPCPSSATPLKKWNFSLCCCRSNVNWNEQKRNHRLEWFDDCKETALDLRHQLKKDQVVWQHHRRNIKVSSSVSRWVHYVGDSVHFLQQKERISDSCFKSLVVSRLFFQGGPSFDFDTPSNLHRFQIREPRRMLFCGKKICWKGSQTDTMTYEKFIISESIFHCEAITPW